MRYTVDRELIVPNEFHQRQITPELLADFEYGAGTEQSLQNIATLLIRASKDGPQWRIGAMALGVDIANSIDVGRVHCEPRTPREDILDITHQWMRESPTSLYVPGPPVELPTREAEKPYFLSAFALIRTTDSLLDIKKHTKFDFRTIWD
jgi:hypothetical protein